MSEHRIIQGDVLDGLRTLPDGCVQCTVTSPPYYGLRNYGVDGQIGLEETPELFVQKMVEVFREVRRVTRPDGVLWLNLGDSYCGCGTGHKETGKAVYEGSDYDGAAKNRTKITGMKSKDMIGIPWMVAFALRADGWYFRSAMPWIKRNCMPESTTDRPTSAIEYILLMTKSARYFYDGEAIRVPAADTAVNNNRDGFRGGNGRLYTQGNTFDNSFKVEKKPKKQDQTGNPTYTGFNERWKEKTKEQAAYGPARDGFNRAGDRNGDQATRNYRNSDPFFESWQGLYSESENPLAFIINPQSRPELHFATFPDLLAETCIKAGTSEYGCCPKCGAPYRRIVEASGGTTGKSWHPHADDETTGQIGGMPTEGYIRQFKGWQPGCKCGEKERVPCLVLDPFMGSGTVAVVARELNRSSVGCELNPEYVKIIRKRLDAGSQLDTGVVSYRFDTITQPGSAAGEHQQQEGVSER
jgi:site-specific DNA-methyltransferase (adenine-specific)